MQRAVCSVRIMLILKDYWGSISSDYAVRFGGYPDVTFVSFIIIISVSMYKKSNCNYVRIFSL